MYSLGHTYAKYTFIRNLHFTGEPVFYVAALSQSLKHLLSDSLHKSKHDPSKGLRTLPGTQFHKHWILVLVLI